ncbi:MAG: DeoR family transcriptional regulator [Myxococcales bacterium]|nr:DeoR family transcriptional regulator [Myxococcales bacterium]
MAKPKKTKKSKEQKADAQPLDERLATLVDEVWGNGPLTVRALQESLPWSRPTLRRVLREAERLGVIRRMKGAHTTESPGRPSDVWELA